MNDERDNTVRSPTRQEAVRFTGRIAPEKILVNQLPKLSDEIIGGFKLLGSATSAVSDALDIFGVTGVVGSGALCGRIAGAFIVGQALTVRNRRRERTPAELAREGNNRMGELEAHNLAAPGEVLVIQGVAGASNLGGVSAQIGKRQGEAGAIVAGGIRDVGDSRRCGYPIWSSEVTPLTGKWRAETVEINGAVHIMGVRVYPGDLVIADDDGVCFVPLGLAERVLTLVRAKLTAERSLASEVAAGVPVWQLAGGARRKQQ